MAEPPNPPRRPTQSGPPSTNRPRSSTTPPVENARASTLREAVTHAFETDREFRKTSSNTAGEGRARRLLVLTIAMIAVSAYSWVARPQFIWGAPVEPPPPQIQQADMRISMFLFGMKVDRFRKKNGAYPETLAALGDSIRGIRYVLLNDSTFELRAKAANHEIVFRSDTTAADFLGEARDLIQSRRKR